MCYIHICYETSARGCAVCCMMKLLVVYLLYIKTHTATLEQKIGENGRGGKNLQSFVE